MTSKEQNRKLKEAKKKTTTKKQNKKNNKQTELDYSKFNLFFKVIKSRESFGRVRERVPEAGGRRDKRVERGR